MRKIRPALVAVAVTGLFMAACRFVPGLARMWQSAAALPFMVWLHEMTGRLPMPVIELAAPAVIILCVALPFTGRRGRRAAFALAALLLAGYGLMWYPAYFSAPAETLPAQTVRQVEALCLRLSDAIDTSPVRLLSVTEAAGMAPPVAGMPHARVKPARFPEWMAALRLAGVFVPWTGEVVVAPDAHPAFIPFTCVHELMHLRGVADEGAANIAAYRLCTAVDGAFADSARLWALRYALAALARADTHALHRAIARLRPGIAALLADSAGGLSPAPPPLSILLGIADRCSDYDALVSWLIAHPGAV